VNTAGGNDDQLDPFELPLPRDPSVRDVLAQLDRIEAKLDKLLEPKRRVASDGSWVETK